MACCSAARSPPARGSGRSRPGRAGSVEERMTKPIAIVVGVGAERGLGAALCRRFAAEGHHVLVAGRTPDKVAQVVRTIAAAGGSAAAVPIDAAREADVTRLFDQAGEVLDPVVFNGGNNPRADFLPVSAAPIHGLLLIGCLARVLGCRA